jgi:hypothetical protein
MLLNFEKLLNQKSSIFASLIIINNDMSYIIEQKINADNTR